MEKCKNFIRYIGYDDKDDFKSFLINKYVMISKNKGKALFFTSPIPKIQNDEVNDLKSCFNIDFKTLDELTIEKNFNYLVGNHIIANFSQFTNLSLKDFAAKVFEAISNICVATNKINNFNFVKSIYINFLILTIRYNCAFNDIFYIGKIDKQDVFFLYIIAYLGGNVEYVNFLNDGTYEAADRNNVLCTVKKGHVFSPIDINYRTLNIEAIEKANNMYDSFTKNIVSAVQVLSTTKETLTNDLLESHTVRLLSRNCNLPTTDVIPVYCLAFLGYNDNIEFNNFIFDLRKAIITSPKPIYFRDKHFNNPTFEESKDFTSLKVNNCKEIISKLALKLIEDTDKKTAIVRNAFVEIMNNINDDNANKLFNSGVKFVTWYDNVKKSLEWNADTAPNNEIPVFMFYGDISPLEQQFLHFLSRSGYDIIYISSNVDKYAHMFEHNNYKLQMQIFKGQNSTEDSPFPEKIFQRKAATTAYTAEKHIKGTLLQENLYFNDFQFKKASALTLKTTYEEISILWKEPAKYRPNFSVENNMVIIPNLFAKIKGIPDNDVDKYWEFIAGLITPETIYQVVNPEAPNVYLDIPWYKMFFKDNLFDISKLRTSTLNIYKHLDDSLELYIFSKFQELLDSGYVSNFYTDELFAYVIQAGFSLTQEELRLLQGFDFTKNPPKLILIDTTNRLFTISECLHILFLNLLGFDILIFSPNGYKNIENYITSDVYEAYMHNSFYYDTNVPSLSLIASRQPKKKTLWDKLFSK